MPRILLIEDDPAIVGFIEQGLREEGFEVECATDGESGLRLALTATFDVIVLDWSLPERDGIAVLRAVRADHVATPVLFLTARDTVAHRVRGLDEGADDYLCKPFAFDELLARLRALARRPPPEKSAVLTWGDVRLDLTTRQVERAGQRIELTAREETLLAYFMRHAEQVLTRGEIYEKVWHEPFDGSSNTLEVHVMELRKKLERHGPRLISTIRGQGYVFGPPSPDRP